MAGKGIGSVWEVVHSDDGDLTERRPCPGGWLYRTSQTAPTAARVVAMVFVPGGEGDFNSNPNTPIGARRGMP